MRNPNALWVVQQLREAWAYNLGHNDLANDRYLDMSRLSEASEAA